MYTNLLLFLVAIFLFSVESVPEHPLLPGWQALALLTLLFMLYNRIAARLFARPQAFRAAGYFRTEKQLSILALLFFGVTLYCLRPEIPSLVPVPWQYHARPGEFCRAPAFCPVPGR